MDIILSLDPGETTGYAVVERESLGPRDMPKIVESGVISLYNGVEALIERHNPSVIVYELFKLFPKNARSQAYSVMHASQVIGVIKYIAAQHSIPAVEQDSRLILDMVMPPDMVRQYRSPHIRDAILHATFYIRSTTV